MVAAQILNRFHEYLEKVSHYQRVNSLLFWDGMQRVPPKGAKGRAATAGVMAEETRKLMSSNELKEYLDALTPVAAELNAFDKALVHAASREYRFFSRIPGALYRELEATKGESIAVWDGAMKRGEFAPMIPYLDRLIQLNRQMADCFGSAASRYDALIDYYEEGMTTAQLDTLFATLKATIIPLVRQVQEKHRPRPAFLHTPVPPAVQDRFNRRLYPRMGVDPESAILCETTHPFSFTINLHDFRFSTRYFENDFSSSLFSVLHEGGHTINSQNIPEKLENTILGGGASPAFQESQGRFYENVIGRSSAFWETVYDDFMEDYRPFLGNLSARDLYCGFNDCRPGYIRTSADEVTYNLHIILRYEMERDFINGSVRAADLPALWNEKMQEYLSLTVPDDRQGVLQDIQWPYGRFGAFVSYSLGNVYNAQLFNAMQKEFDVYQRVREGDFASINQWLGENLHRYSRLYTPQETLRRTVGGSMDAKPYCDYLTAKMTDVYQI